MSALISTQYLLWSGLIAIALGLFTATIVLGGWAGRRRDISRSLSTIASYRSGAAPSAREQALGQPLADRVVAPVIARFATMGHRLTDADRLSGLRARLDVAGNPEGWDVDRVVGAKAMSAMLGLAVSIAACASPLVGGAWWAVLPVLAAVFSWFLPDLALYQIGYNRSERIRDDLSQSIDLMTISVEAGLGFDAALAHVAANTKGPLSAELFRALQEMQIGTGRLNALRAMANRSDVEEVRSFVGALVQAESFGIPTAKFLRVQAAEMRTKRSQRAQEQAQKVPVKILFPLILCILPVLFIVAMGPAAIQLSTMFSQQ